MTMPADKAAQVPQDLQSTRPDDPLTLGRFVLLSLRGQGGMGRVYEAYDPNLDRRVALKLLRADKGDASKAIRKRERLLREAQALARLSHPNVVPIHDVGIIDEQVFLVMEYVSGMTLRQWAAVKERPWQEIVAGYCQAGRGLAAAHAAGLVHRDFKPDNALIGEDERVRVLDFGLARTQTDTPLSPQGSGEAAEAGAGRDMGAAGQAAGEPWWADAPLGGTPGASVLEETVSVARTPMDRSLTAAGALIGTPSYMAPEQVGGAGVGPAADQFSFCVALYEALYGQKPFAADSITHRQALIHKGRVTPPPEDKNVPSWLYQVLCRGLLPDPAERYSSMDALLAELGRDRESDLSIVRRAAVLYMGTFIVIGIAVAVAAVFAGLGSVAPTEPVSLHKAIYAACVIGAFTSGVAIWRRALMANEVARKLMLSMVTMMLAVMLHRFIAWYAGIATYEEAIAEFVTVGTGAAVGAVSFMPRLALISVWAAIMCLLVLLSPEDLFAFRILGFTGTLLIFIWVWFGQRASVPGAVAATPTRLAK